MSLETRPPSLPQALESLLRWRESADQAVRGSLEDIALEQEEAERHLVEAQRQVRALAALRDEQLQLRDGLDREQRRLELQAVRSCLADERQALAARNTAWLAEAQRMASAAAARMAAPDVAALLAEWERLTGAESDLGALPFSQRKALAERRERVRASLDPILEQAFAPPSLSSLPRLGCSVVLATDAPEGRAESLVLVMPVSAAISQEWSSREDDLLGFFSWRVVSVIYMLLRELDALDAPLRSFDLHGSLAIHVWLGDHEIPGDLQDRTLDLFQAMASEAPELEEAGVEIYALWVSPGLLAPEES